MMNKTSCHSILENLKAREDHKIQNSSAMALLKGREMVFKAFESGIFLKPEELKQSKKATGLKM